MSSNYSKLTITFDNNCGQMQTDTIYIKFNNTTDAQTYVYSNGQAVDLCYRTDDWMKCFSDFLSNNQTPQWVCIPIRYIDLPIPVQNVLS